MLMLVVYSNMGSDAWKYAQQYGYTVATLEEKEEAEFASLNAKLRLSNRKAQFLSGLMMPFFASSPAMKPARP